jgi:hypothetical protein
MAISTNALLAWAPVVRVDPIAEPESFTLPGANGRPLAGLMTFLPKLSICLAKKWYSGADLFGATQISAVCLESSFHFATTPSWGICMTLWAYLGFSPSGSNVQF